MGWTKNPPRPQFQTTMSKEFTFKPPQKLLDAIGTNLEAGSRLPLRAEFCVEPDGSWCITRVEGVPFPGYDGEGKDKGDEGESYKTGQFAEAYKKNMSGEE